MDLVRLFRDLVVNLRDDDVRCRATETEESGVEAQGPALVDSSFCQDRFEERLREIDVVAGARRFVGALEKVNVSARGM